MYNKWESLKNPMVQCGQLVYLIPNSSFSPHESTINSSQSKSSFVDHKLPLGCEKLPARQVMKNSQPSGDLTLISEKSPFRSI